MARNYNKSDKQKSEKKNSYNDKKYSANKTEPKIKPSEKVIVPDLRASQISGVSRLKTNKFGIFYKIAHFEVDDQGIGSMNILENQITTTINRFSTERGYTSTVDFAIIQAHLKKVFSVLAGTAALLRVQNALKYRSATGEILPSGFYTIPSPGTYDSAERLYTGITVSATGSRFNDSITNHSWTTDLVSPMLNVYATQHMIDTVIGVFSSIHRSTSMRDEEMFHAFWPKNTISYSDLKSDISGVLQDYVDYPDLELILNLLGLKPIANLNFDLNRDAAQQTIFVRTDGYSDMMLANSQWFIAYNEYTTSVAPSNIKANEGYPATFLSLPGSDATILDPQELSIRSIPKETYLSLKLFNDGIRYLGLFVQGKYTTGGSNVTIFERFILPFALPGIRKTFGSTTIAGAGGAGTGVLDATWLGHLNSADIADAGLPWDGFNYLEVTKGTNSLSDPELRLRTLSLAQTSANYSVGSKMTTFDLVDAQFYLDNRMVYLVNGSF